MRYRLGYSRLMLVKCLRIVCKYTCTYTMSTVFEWDGHKNRVNVRKHGIDFRDPTAIFQQAHTMDADPNWHRGEQRWVAVGWVNNVLCKVVFTLMHEAESFERIRLISARKATAQEKRHYEEKIRH